MALNTVWPPPGLGEKDRGADITGGREMESTPEKSVIDLEQIAGVAAM